MIGIDFTTTGGIYALGALDNTNATTRTINNSTTTPGVLTLNGATVNAAANTILRNTTANTLTLANGSGTGTLDIRLGITQSIIQITGTGGVTINGSITEKDAGSGIILRGGGTGSLILNGVNTYSGITAINTSTLTANSTDALGNGSATNTLIFTGGTLQASGDIISPATRPGDAVQHWEDRYQWLQREYRRHHERNRRDQERHGHPDAHGREHLQCGIRRSALEP